MCYQRECTHEPSSCPLPALSSNLQPLVSAAPPALPSTAASPHTLSPPPPSVFAVSPAVQRCAFSAALWHTPLTPLNPKLQIGDVVVDAAFFSGGGGSSAWSGNRSFVFTLAAPTSLLFAVRSFILTGSAARRLRHVTDACSAGQRGVPRARAVAVSSIAGMRVRV